MTTYVVTAGNRFFWQSLVVNADDIDLAIGKFEAFLTSPHSKAEEDEEYETAQQVHDNPDRDDYTYRFDASDVVEEYRFPHWVGTPTDSVQVMHSGGNG